MTTSFYRRQIMMCAIVFICCLFAVAAGVAVGGWFNYVIACFNIANCAAQVFLIHRWLHIYRKERGFE